MSTAKTPQWKKDLRPGSFRGVPFYLQSSDREGGRRGVTHEFVQRDKPFGEDTGKMPAKFSLEMYVLGANYNTLRDALVDALEKEGPGELIHPYYGRQIVDTFGGYKIRETSKEGGICTITCTFTEHGEDLFPITVVDPSFAVSAAADAVQKSASNNFLENFNLNKLPAFALTDATSKIGALATTLSTASTKLTLFSPAIADFSFAVKRLGTQVTNLIKSPSKLAAEVQNDISLLAQAGGVPKEVFGALANLFGFGSGDAPIAPVTVTRVQQAQNRVALNDFTRTMAVTEAARLSPGITFTSNQDALYVRQQMLDTTDDLMNRCDDDTYQAFQVLRQTIVAAVPGPDAELATVGTVTIPSVIPSLVLAYNLYGSVDLEPDVVSRNDIRHPGFMPAGIPLEVLQT